MALGETAKLIAELSLKDNMSKGIASATAGIGKLEGRLGKIGGIASKGVKTAAHNIALIGVAAAAAVTGAVVEGIKSLASIQKVQAQTNAVLKSTGGIAKQTFEEITARSQKWSAAIGKNEEDVQNLQNVLLTFTNIGPTVFDEATTAALDMSQALGTDSKGRPSSSERR